MSETIPVDPEVIDRPAYFPRLGRYDGRAIEEALAGASLFEPGIQIEGAIVEATYAVTEPALVKRLREDDVPFLIDLQTLRFATPTYQEVEPLASLPYAPPRPIETEDAGGPLVAALGKNSLLFQQSVGARYYLAPSKPNLSITSRAVGEKPAMYSRRWPATFDGSSRSRRKSSALVL